MKTIQIINYSKERCFKHCTSSMLSAPRSLDEFDLNIIDLSDENMWYSDEIVQDKIHCFNDLNSLNVMVKNSRNTQIIFVLPQDIKFHRFNGTTTGPNSMIKKNHSSTRLKDLLTSVVLKVFSVFDTLHPFFSIVYENTTTTIGEVQYKAAFYFQIEIQALTYSDSGQKPTTIKAFNRFYFTTLNILSDESNLMNFIDSVFGPSQQQQQPEWMDSINFNDDAEQKAQITIHEQIIQSAEEAIECAKKKLQENARYKSILFTNGNELVAEVFEILEHILDCDLSGFVDEKKEDFLIQKPGFTLIGEVKGITSNVKNEHVSQLEHHFQQYKDRLDEEGRSENVHQVLIINPLRNKPLNEREPVHENQIALANRNGSLIIETVTLLKMFELFLQGKLSSDSCIKLLTERTGILRIQASDNDSTANT